MHINPITIHEILGITILKLKNHPYKTMLGRIVKVLDFLGINLDKVIRITNKSIENHRLRISQRYAHFKSKSHIALYIKAWHKWYRSLSNCCRESISAINLEAILPILVCG